jgi:GNAT superfamily N-acetyltransferase
MAVIRLAYTADVDRILPLLREFYEFERITPVENHVELLHELVSNAETGRLILLEDGPDLIGYAILGFGFSLEFGGHDALLDEFYVRESHRGRGLGNQVLDYVEGLCREAGVRAIHLEADHFNSRVHEYYKRRGFRDHERHLMTKWL